MTHLVQLDMGPTTKFVIAVASVAQAQDFKTTREGRSIVFLGEKAAALVTSDQSDPGARHHDFHAARSLEDACKRHGAQRISTCPI